jgi:hypothetical protein
MPSSRQDDPYEFKRCIICEKSWCERDEFLNDPELEFIGYQAFLEDGVLGFFMFNHDPCGTTLTVRTDKLREIAEGPILVTEGSEKPSPHCLTVKDGKPCPPECECAFVKTIIQKLVE